MNSLFSEWYIRYGITFLAGVVSAFFTPYFAFKVNQRRQRHNKRIELICRARAGINMAIDDGLNPNFLARQWYQEIRQHINPKIIKEVEAPANQLVIEMGSAAPIKANYRLNLIHEEVSKLAKQWKIQ